MKAIVSSIEGSCLHPLVSTDVAANPASAHCLHLSDSVIIHVGAGTKQRKEVQEVQSVIVCARWVTSNLDESPIGKVDYTEAK